MSKLNWQKTRSDSRQAQQHAQADSKVIGVLPATPKQIKYLEALCRKLGHDSVNAYIIPFKGDSQTLSAKQASKAIEYALQRIGGPAPKP